MSHQVESPAPRCVPLTGFHALRLSIRATVADADSQSRPDTLRTEPHESDPRLQLALWFGCLEEGSGGVHGGSFRTDSSVVSVGCSIISGTEDTLGRQGYCPGDAPMHDCMWHSQQVQNRGGPEASAGWSRMVVLTSWMNPCNHARKLLSPGLSKSLPPEPRGGRPEEEIQVCH